jgi:hypothetical protein
MSGSTRYDKRALAAEALRRVSTKIVDGVIVQCEPLLKGFKGNTAKWKEILGDRTEIATNSIGLNHADTDAFRKWIKSKGFVCVGKSIYKKQKLKDDNNGKRGQDGDNLPNAARL